MAVSWVVRNNCSSLCLAIEWWEYMGLLSRLLGQESAPDALGSLSFVVLDVETTGLSPNGDRIVEIALVRLAPDGRPIDEWTTRIDPEVPIGATHIHGITQADVAGKPRFSALAAQLADLLGDLPIVAHNATFDLAFLRCEFERAGWDMPHVSSFCTLDASYTYFPSLDRRRLADCCWAAGVRQERVHSALHDARATAGLFAQYLARDPHLRDRVSVVGRDSWPAGPTREPTVWVPQPSRDRPQRFTAPRLVGPPLVKQLSSLSLAEVIEEGAPIGSLAYLETLLTALEDGELSASESQQMAALSYAYELMETDVQEIHRAFVLALAHRALDDGHVSHIERDELYHLASTVGVPRDVVLAAINRADTARSNRMSAELGSLPEDWAYGEPLRVGDKIVFTGCDETQRTRLEQRAESLGVRVVGSVSRQTAMLVTDGGFEGTKAAKAAELSIRKVHPDLFQVFLDHLQPTRPPVDTLASRVIKEQGAAPGPAASTQIGARGAAPSVVRAWALANGLDVGVRGRLNAQVFDAYWNAQVAAADSGR